MIEIRLGASDLARMRFAYSPLAEVGECLYLLASGRVPQVHRPWYESVRRKLGGVDLTLLRAVVPGTMYVPRYLFGAVTSPGASIDIQLDKVAGLPPEVVHDRLDHVWRGGVLPPAAQALVAEGAAGPAHLADELGNLWSAAVEPSWSAIRPVLDDDVAYRARELTRRGVDVMLGGLHEDITVRGETPRVSWRLDDGTDPGGDGLILVPSVFAWPNAIFVAGKGEPSVLTYGARGVGTVWGPAEERLSDEDALGSLIGRSRAAILLALAVPHSTTELAVALGQSPPSVSQHLSVLRRSGLVTSWRSGRSVLYRQTPLAASVIAAHQSDRTARASGDG